MLSDTLYRLWCAAEIGHKTPEERVKCRNAYNSVMWFVCTGRAPPTWAQALAAADPQKLLAFMVNGGDQSIDGQVTLASEYLNRYCHFSEKPDALCNPTEQ